MGQTYAVFWNSEDHTKLMAWWSSLKRNPGWRAELRRAVSPTDVLLCQGFRYLCYELAGYWTQEQNLLGLAAVAGVVAHIENDNGQTFATACATPVEGKDKPAMSELRFAQLQKSRSLDELFTRMIRAIHLMRKSANPVSVADSILHWTKEMVNGDIDSDPRKRILVRWGLDYFQHLPKMKTK
jgi:CRISPR system Cascade subunit CasB